MLFEKNFGNSSGLIYLRDEIIDKPFSAPGIVKLDYDPRVILDQQYFPKIYESDTGQIFKVP